MQFDHLKDLDFFPCPICGGRLVERKGRFGDFVGCANFPRCRHTEKAKKKKVS